MKRILLFVMAMALLLAPLTLPAHAAEKEEFRALRAVRISDCEVVLEFSKPLDDNGIDLPFTALRWMTMKNGKPHRLAWAGETPLQSAQFMWHFWSEEDHTKVVIVFDAKSLDLYSETAGNWCYNKGFRAFLVIEEKDPGVGHNHKTLQDVHSVDGDELRSTCEGSGNDWDAVCLEIEEDYNYIPSSFVYTPSTDAPESTPSQGDDSASSDAPSSDTEKPTEQSGCGAVLTGSAAVIAVMMGAVLLIGTKRTCDRA